MDSMVEAVLTQYERRAAREAAHDLVPTALRITA
jgi:hypothetical protein